MKVVCLHRAWEDDELRSMNELLLKRGWDCQRNKVFADGHLHLSSRFVLARSGNL